MSFSMITANRKFPSVFDSFLEDVWLSPPTNYAKTLVSRPKVHINEDEERYVLTLSAPGVDKDDFNVTLSDGKLTLEYTKGEKDNRHFNYTSFKRSWSVPKETKAKDINASCEKGVFAVEVKKLQPELPEVEVIEVK